MTDTTISKNINTVVATKKPKAEPDREQAKRFLAWLGGGTAFFTFQTFDDNEERSKAHAAANAVRKKQGKKPLSSPFVRVLNGTLAQHWNTLARLNARGAGIYITINQTNLRGRKTEDIVKVRALFVDLDGAPLPQHGPKPHIVVETSLGHWHVYWHVSDVALEEFADKQRALIALHGGDRAVHDLPRVMRLPGFFHCKGKPRLVRIMSTSNAPDYAGAEFPTAQPEPRKPNAVLTADDARLARALAFIPNPDVDWKQWCDLGLAIFGATGGSDMGFAMFDAWSQRSAKYDPHYTLKTWHGFERSPPNRIGAGTIFYLANKNCPKWADWLDARKPDALDMVAAFLESVS
jgi:Primase C terminal 2 (PriCT-2)/RepB DNA-primase N-terminal domain